MENIVGGTSLPSADVGVPSFSHVLAGFNNSMVGFKEEFDIITECLVGEEKGFKVISIVGMPGIGKSTLAINLFKSYCVVHHFDILARGIVSQTFDKRGFIPDILSQVKDLSSVDISQLDEEALADMLCKNLKKHRYLILIDDVWDINVWHYLKRYLPDDKQGSRVLITTRNTAIASDIGSEVHILGLLGEDESWELFQKRLSKKENLSGDLLNIAKKISKGCKGLPLSIVVIAGVLSNVERSEPSWNQISRSMNLHILADPQSNCKTILDTSFNNLPRDLQPCFLYLGVFPEDKEISVSRLTWLWMAEGFVQDTESKSSEDVAKDYIMNFLLRNLVIPPKERPEGGVKTFHIHDILRGFCLEKAREWKHILRVSKLGNHSLIRLTSNKPGTSHNILSSCNVRSAFLFSREDYFELNSLLRSNRMVQLQVLDAPSMLCTSDDLSLFVGLRYLAIWRLIGDYDYICTSMPSITMFRNLQTLVLEEIKLTGDMVEVPDSIWDLVKLRHLHVRNRASFELDSLRIRNNPPFLLEDLRSLSKPDLSHDDLKWLRRLPKLQKLSWIVSKTWDEYLECDRIPDMDFLTQLTSLKIQLWVQSKDDMRRCNLHLPLNIKKLTLRAFFLNSDELTKIGRMVPFLQVLKLYQCGPWGSEEVEEWSVSDEDFPKLKVLKLAGVRFDEWTASGDSFPCLEKLWVINCHDLEAIPRQFGDIPMLRLISVRNCKASVDSSAKAIERIQHEGQNEKLEVSTWRIFLVVQRLTTVDNIGSLFLLSHEDKDNMHQLIMSNGMVQLHVLDAPSFLYTNDDLSHLVGLRYLAIWRLIANYSTSMPPITMLRNLQTLIFEELLPFSDDVVEVPDSIWDLVKLRHLHVRNRASFELDSLRIQNNPPYLLEDLRSLSKPKLSHDDLMWLRKLPKLQKLSCIISETWDDRLKCHSLPHMEFLSQLTSLKMELWMQSEADMRRYNFILPLNLKKLTLKNFVLNSQDISEIGKMLSFLEVLKLYQSGPWDSKEVEEWSVSDEDFPSLKVLKLADARFNEWTSSDDAFPCLEKLWVENCVFLEAIPLQFGDIPMLRFISVRNCKSSVDCSAREIEMMQREGQNEELEVYIYPKKPR